MKVLPLFAGLMILGLAGCKPPESAPVEAAEPAPAATPGAQVIEAAPAAETFVVEEITGAVESPEAIDMDPATLENQRIKEEVLKRIDVMPALSASDKDRLYVQVERARSMGKVITIPFSTGASRVPMEVITALGTSLEQPQVRTLADDPTVVFVILGFADKKGDPAKNVEISTRRAESVLALLRDRFKVLNVMHAVGMGSSEMFDADDLDKNRVVEVWAVLP
ncbi:MAG: OmpA family protein [Chthoniobacterales bacterium]